MTLTIYTTSWCGPCKRLKAQLTREGIAYREIDVERDPDAAEFVKSVNNGNQTVPTVVFPDGTAVTNPPVTEVKARLAALAGPSERSGLAGA
ncbi:mycoredoxin [Thermostaphylospora chromogena]|uniref:Mycoredoxin n=1 Tax=Thermostaphylospora chromogena TaxID=35622 RepID=A0A1H1AWY8_9ACTN|nr:mycoredoxin [Thermostaphylospora chromogena]SDQ44051.1 mycoredoxin [Thermostaphylospora chromogena]